MIQPVPAPREAARVTLPYAAACAGDCAGDWGRPGDATLNVRALTGADELAFDEALAEGATAAFAATLLIARCAIRSDEGLGDDPVGDAAAWAMALGDREVLLRALHAVSFGPRFAARVSCTAGCAEAIEFDVDLAGLTQPAPEAGPLHPFCVDSKTLALRVPTGADLELALRQGGDPAAALAAACSGGAAIDLELLSAELSRLDPNAECALALACPGCGAPVEAVLDGLALIRSTLAEGGGFMAQVDLLARAYGWTEAEVLALPRARRLRYCALAKAGAAA